ncbi:radical SAM family heme chaperone HemW [Croceicoccus sp. F390]|uniref:Heme chaperone HemW n=1 Tax=Croceicoccus esteveae TaxID=3075597 RepID=A0ABU2ZG25_9SPHN|nr:radical SAM family heme chaperone HemW [Croceicoccus sp. F390]MDT0575546.1 radical SAM family heme chaperone HemW [Croceicoccus sp. F390]
MSLALYIHWPFCLKKCPYCDFNSHVRNDVDEARWAEALIADMRHEAQQTGPREVTSIFFGGGTPSLMPPALVARLIDTAAQLWTMSQEVEITLEANPSSVEAARFEDLGRAGVNRVSLGVQSLDDAALNFLGRLHDADEALTALQIAQASFRQVSFDLIYALPGQTAPQWQAQLRAALSLGTDHLSLYQLTIEPGTRFATDVRRGRFQMPSDDLCAQLFTLTREETQAAGLAAYEVSNHARPGAQSRHNLTYWRYGDYAGVGPGAHGRRGGTATRRHRKPENFLTSVLRQNHGICETAALGLREQAAEALMMGLRLTEGIDLAALSRRFCLPAHALVDLRKLQLHCDLGFVRHEGDLVQVTQTGMLLLDGVLADIVQADLLAA